MARKERPKKSARTTSRPRAAGGPKRTADGDKTRFSDVCKSLAAGVGALSEADRRAVKAAFDAACTEFEDPTPDEPDTFDWEAFMAAVPDELRSDAEDVRRAHAAELIYRGENWASKNACEVLRACIPTLAD